jgi:hypothetical protein
VKSLVTLSASTPELISILGEIISKARLWNRSQSVTFLTGSERFLILTWSSMWNTTGRRSESKISETMTADILVDHNVQHVTITRMGIVSGALWRWNFELACVKY